ncbi:Adenine deaminase [subsurface metagenome]
MGTYDLVIKKGLIIDGLGNPVPYLPWRHADIAITGDKIVFIGDTCEINTKETIDADGLIVSPGFIDIHSHSDGYLIANPKAESKVRQGVTTEVIGNCGLSAAPVLGEYKLSELTMPDFLSRDWTTFEDYIHALEKNGSSVNVIPLVGHSNIRGAVMGYHPGRPSDEQLNKMKSELKEAFDSGAWGMSAGLIYVPGSFSDREELSELCKTVERYDGVFHIHIRGQGGRLIAATMEALEIAENSGVSLNIHHHKGMGDSNSPKVMFTLSLVEKARAKGLKVVLDMYPYTAGQGGLSMFLPPCVREGGPKELIKRLKDPNLRERIKREMIEPELVPGYQSYTKELGWDLCWDNVLICRCKLKKNKGLSGYSITKAKPDWQEPVDFIINLLIEEGGEVPVVIPDFINLDDRYLQMVLRHPVTMFGSDGYALCPHGPLGEWTPHPRSYGTFPRVLGRYVRQRKLFTWQEAIRKMTSLAASFLGIKDRGILREGAYADITIFNPETVIDRSTFSNPHQYPVGIEYVIVNGTVVIRKGEHTGTLGGKVLCRD